MSVPKYVNIGSVPTRMMEEVGELLQALAKCERFGYTNHHPARPESNNLKELLAEIADVREMLDKLATFADLEAAAENEP